MERAFRPCCSPDSCKRREERRRMGSAEPPDVKASKREKDRVNTTENNIRQDHMLQRGQGSWILQNRYWIFQLSGHREYF